VTSIWRIFLVVSIFPVTKRIIRKDGYLSKGKVLSVKRSEDVQGSGSTALLFLNPDTRCIKVASRRPRPFYFGHTFNRHLGQSRAGLDLLEKRIFYYLC
jgi:hypothetical protein